MVKASATLPNLTGTLVDDGRLELLRVIGAGAFGRTYKARDTTTPSPTFFAVKCLKKPANSLEADFQAREHTLHRRVSRHANVVGVHRHFTDEQHVFIVMELCEGGDMHGAIMDGVYRGNPELIKRAFAELIDGVRYCHSARVFHRDLKPANVLVNPRGGRPLVADFGLSTASKLSRELGCGSPGYMTPESFKPASSKSAPSHPYCPAHSDAWALAVILINLVTGQNPWEAAKPDDRRWKGFLADPDFLREILPVSRPLQELLKRCFDLDPALRPTLTEMRAEVLALPELFMSAADLERASPGVRRAAGLTAPPAAAVPIYDPSDCSSNSSASGSGYSTNALNALLASPVLAPPAPRVPAAGGPLLTVPVPVPVPVHIPVSPSAPSARKPPFPPAGSSTPLAPRAPHPAQLVQLPPASSIEDRPSGGKLKRLMRRLRVWRK